jgi:hypothetical protein
MQQRGVIHPDMLDRLRVPVDDFYPSLCTIASASVVQDEYGQEEGVLTPVEGLTNLPCRIAPRSSGETRSTQQVYAEASHHVALAGYYPAIQTTHAAQVDGVTYDIEGVEHDGNHTMTRLFLRLVD